MIAETVVDRPGVPDVLRDRYWYSADYEPRQAGHLGTTARIIVPADELPIAADDGLVATVLNGPLAAPHRSSIVRVREIATGETLLEFATPLYVEVGAIAGDRLFISGRGINPDGAGGDDAFDGGGVWAIELTEGAKPTEVVPPEPDGSLDDNRETGARGLFKLSPTGATLASAVYAEGEVQRVDVIDVATLSVRASLKQFVYALNDDFAIARPVDDPVGEVAQLVSLRTGNIQWEAQLRDARGNEAEWFQMISALAGESDMFLEFERGSDLVLLSLNISTGKAAELLVQDNSARDARPIYMAPQLSSATAIVLLPVPGVGRAIDLAGGRADVAVFEVASQTLSEDLFKIGAP
jgi:hypothetical protein